MLSLYGILSAACHGNMQRLARSTQNRKECTCGSEQNGARQTILPCAERLFHGVPPGKQMHTAVPFPGSERMESCAPAFYCGTSWREDTDPALYCAGRRASCMIKPLKNETGPLRGCQGPMSSTTNIGRVPARYTHRAAHGSVCPAALVGIIPAQKENHFIRMRTCPAELICSVVLF